MSHSLPIPLTALVCKKIIFFSPIPYVVEGEKTEGGRASGASRYLITEFKQSYDFIIIGFLALVKNVLKKSRSGGTTDEESTSSSNRPVIVFKRHTKSNCTGKESVAKTIDLERVTGSNETILHLIQGEGIADDEDPSTTTTATTFVYDEYRMLTHTKTLEDLASIPRVFAWENMEEGVFLPDDISDPDSDNDCDMIMDEDSNAEDYFANEYPDEEESNYNSECDSEDSFRPSFSRYNRRKPELLMDDDELEFCDYD